MSVKEGVRSGETVVAVMKRGGKKKTVAPSLWARIKQWIKGGNRK